MERIFPNLYRFTDEPVARGRHYSYLIVREQGNVLVPSLPKSLPDHVDEIEALGGVDTQFVNHVHDVARDGFHDAVFERFGARLHYHQVERKKVRTKTKCPAVEYDDAGFQVGTDFRAIYYPGCTLGHSIFHWGDGDDHFLFTSHVIGLAQGDWNISLKPATIPHLRPNILEIAKLPMDYALPTGSRYGQEEYRRFNDYTRKSFATAVRATVRQAAKLERAA